MKKNSLIFLAFLALVLICFYRFLDPNNIFAFKDLGRYFYPLRSLMVQTVMSGQLPLWNPFIYCGFPLFATLQVGFLYPLTFILYIMPFHLGFNYYIILHYFLAACFTYLLLKHFKVSDQGSFLGAVIFTFSGYLLSVANMNTSLSSVIWLPLVLLFFDKLLSRFRIMDFIRLVIFLALMLLGGEPTILYITAGFLFFYALFIKWGSWDVFGRKVLLLLVAFLVVGALCAVQLFPFVELLKTSDRVGNAPFDKITMRSLPVRETINIVMPFFFGNQMRPGIYVERFLGDKIQDWLISTYLGFISLFLAGFAFVKKTRRKWFFVSAAVLSMVLAYGKYTPVYFLLYKFMPGFSMIRYPIKYIFIFTFAVSVLAAFGFDDLFESLRERKELIVKTLLGLTVFAAFLGGIYLLASFFRTPVFLALNELSAKPLADFFLISLWEHLGFDIQSLQNLVIYILTFVLMLFACLKGWIKPKLAGVLIIALIVFDLLSANSGINSFFKRSKFEAVPPNVKIVLNDKDHFRLFYTPALEKQNRMFYSPDFDKASFDLKDKFAANFNLPHGMYDTYGYSSIRSKDYLDFIKYFRPNYGTADHRCLDLMNAKYIASVKKLNVPDFKLKRHSKQLFGEIYLYRNLSVLPRAFMVFDWKEIAEREDILEYMISLAFKPDQEIVIEERLDLPDHRAGWSKYKKVEIIEYGPQEVVIKTSSKIPGFLFLSDTYYPGWKAYLDEEEVKIFRTNYLFRAVWVPAGSHQVVFKYIPKAFWFGLLVSSITLLTLIGLAIRSRRS